VGGNLITGFSHAFLNEFQKIEEMAKQTLKFCRDVGCEVWGTMAEMLAGITYVSSGQMSKGIKMVEQVRDAYQKNQRKGTLVIPEYMLGRIYLQIVEGENLPSFSVLARNIGFMVKNVPYAAKKAEDQFNSAIKIAKEVGSNIYMGRAYLDLGVLHKAKKRTNEAKACMLKAVELFEQCEAEVFLQEAKEALAALE
jgi:tetratricopeptide (TPR) repeat protein